MPDNPEIIRMDIDTKLGIAIWIVNPGKAHAEEGDTMIWSMPGAETDDIGTVNLPPGVFNKPGLVLNQGNGHQDSAIVNQGQAVSRHGYDIYVNGQGVGGPGGTEPTIFID